MTAHLSLDLLRQYSQQCYDNERNNLVALWGQYKEDIKNAKGDQTFIYHDSARIESLNCKLDELKKEVGELWNTLVRMQMSSTPPPREPSRERYSPIPDAESTLRVRPSFNIHVKSDKSGLAPGCVSGCIKWAARPGSSDGIGCSSKCQCLYCLWSDRTQQYVKGQVGRYISRKV